MTTPSWQQLRPSPPERYEEQSFHSLEQAEEELAKGDARQAAEKIWIAAANALKAVAQRRGWNHRYHNHLRSVASYLAAEWNRPDLHIAFTSLESLHVNHYEHQYKTADVRPFLDFAKTYCQSIVQMLSDEPPSQQHITAEQRRAQESRLRTLTRPLPPHAAFGPELSAEELAELPPVRPPHD